MGVAYRGYGREGLKPETILDDARCQAWLRIPGLGLYQCEAWRRRVHQLHTSDRGRLTWNGDGAQRYDRRTRRWETLQAQDWIIAGASTSSPITPDILQAGRRSVLEQARRRWRGEDVEA